jgi:hypothetical protein
VEKRGDDARAAGPDRMTERDGAAVDIDLVPIEAQLATVREGLSRESFVDLDEVEGVDRELDPVEETANTLDGREEEPLRGDLGLGVPDDPGEGLEPESFDATTVAAAPSVMPGALPAVTVPSVASPRSSPAGSAKTGFRRARAWALVSRRGPSSVVTTASRPFASRIVTAAVSASKRPASMAAIAFW